VPSHFVVLSDLHLGYDNSVLNDHGAQERLASEIAKLCGGDTDRLILNGDAFEACIPRGAGKYDPAGFAPFMASCARGFFEALLTNITIESLIIVWGNHDYALWKHVATSCGVPTFTNLTKGDILLQRDGQDLPGATAFLDDVIGPGRLKFARIRAAYPNYILGRYWPYLTFHHGHFLDDLILGQAPEAQYLGLRALTGAGRPAVNVSGDETVKSLYDKTEAFISATWESNSRAREIEWAMIRRTQSQPTPCSYFPVEKAPSEMLVATLEPFGNDLGKNALWYANVLMADSTTPAPLGRADTPSFLFVGHDHRGGFKNIMSMDNRPWRVVNTGGWTRDGNSPAIHGHVTLWSKDKNEPSVHCVSV
jgi:hypothetical protein